MLHNSRHCCSYSPVAGGRVPEEFTSGASTPISSGNDRFAAASQSHALAPWSCCGCSSNCTRLPDSASCPEWSRPRCTAMTPSVEKDGAQGFLEPCRDVGGGGGRTGAARARSGGEGEDVRGYTEVCSSACLCETCPLTMLVLKVC